MCMSCSSERFLVKRCKLNMYTNEDIMYDLYFDLFIGQTEKINTCTCEGVRIRNFRHRSFFTIISSCDDFFCRVTSNRTEQQNAHKNIKND